MRQGIVTHSHRKIQVSAQEKGPLISEPFFIRLTSTYAVPRLLERTRYFKVGGNPSRSYVLSSRLVRSNSSDLPKNGHRFSTLYNADANIAGVTLQKS
jgi:hypothetical protein